MFKITAEIQSLLLQNEEIKALVGNRVFPIMAPEGTDGDFIVYQRDGLKQEYTQMGVASQTAVIYVTAVSDSYVRNNSLASLIYDTLSGDYKDPDMRIQLEDSTEDFIDKKFIQVLQFSIKQR
ncbi:DUF3168 domain-containing protein [Bacteroides uniformis]